VVIDSDETGLIGQDPFAEIILAMTFAEQLQGDEVFGGMLNPEHLGAIPDPAMYFRSRFPVLMSMLQAHRSVLQFEDEESKEQVLGLMMPAIGAYEGVARHLLRLQHTWNTSVVTSVIEQPLLSAFLVDEACRPFEDGTIQRQLGEQCRAAALGALGRKRHFEQWRFPPLGLLALSEANSLEDVPAQLDRARDQFARLRRTLCELEARRAELVRRAAEFTREGEEANVELDKLDLEVREALEAFDEEVTDRRSRFRRTEVIFNIFGYVLDFAGGLGLGSLGTLAAALGLKRRAILQRVPGLFKAASFITGRDAAMPSEVIENLLRRNKGDFEPEAAFLEMGMAHATSYAETRYGEAPPEIDVEIECQHGKFQDSDRTLWIKLLADDAYRPLLEL
jgi:hypothetical protein